jgi:hypothetical protein
MSMIVFCVCEKERLPDWVAEVMLKAHVGWQSGQLESWESVFGKPHRGKTRKGAQRDDPMRMVRVCEEVLRLRQKGRPMDTLLFEDVGRKFGIAATTVKRLVYGYRS